MYGKALEIMPMKVNRIPKGKGHMRKEVCTNGKYFGQIKKDGWWYQYEKDADGNGFLFSRDISTKTNHLSEKSDNVPHIMEFLNRKLPNETIIIGEMYYPDKSKSSKDVGKIMGALPEKAVSRQEQPEYGKIHYYIHDIIWYDGSDLIAGKWTNYERYNLLIQVFNKCLTGSEYIELADIFLNITDKDGQKLYPLIEKAHYVDLDNWIDELIENGEEGAVLKLKSGCYQPDKKPAWQMIKFKAEDEADVVCLGFEPPTKEYKGDDIYNWEWWEDKKTGLILNNYPRDMGEYHHYIEKYNAVSKLYAKGWIGSMRIGVMKDGQLIDVGDVHSGFNESDLEEIKIHPIDFFLNRPLEVQHMPTAGYEGTLRHPRFVRWRDDLNIKDCTYEKIWD